MTSQVVPRLGDDWTPEEVGEALDRAGCCVFDGLLEADVLDAIRHELDPHASVAALGVGEFEGIRTRRTGAVVLRSETYRSIARHPAIRAAGDHVLGYATTWMLSATELIEIFPGQPAQPVHRDQWKYDYVDLPVEVEVNAMWAMTDFTEANGATRVVPGSHHLANDLRFDHADTVAAEMSKGSLLVYLGRTYHSGGANLSGEVRIGLSLQHSVGWLARGEQMMIECPPDVVAEWDDDLTRFIGYQMTGDSLGVYRDSEDPMTAVHPDREYARGWIVTPTGVEMR